MSRAGSHFLHHAEVLVDRYLDERKDGVQFIGRRVVDSEAVGISEQMFCFRLATKAKHRKSPAYRLIAVNRDMEVVAAEITNKRGFFFNINDEFLVTNTFWNIRPTSANQRAVQLVIPDKIELEFAYLDGYLYGVWKSREGYHAFRIPLVKPGLEMQWSHVGFNHSMRGKLSFLKNKETGVIAVEESWITVEFVFRVSTVLFDDDGQRYLNQSARVNLNIDPVIYTVQTTVSQVKLEKKGSVYQSYIRRPIRINPKQLNRVLKRRETREKYGLSEIPLGRVRQ